MISELKKDSLQHQTEKATKQWQLENVLLSVVCNLS